MSKRIATTTAPVLKKPEGAELFRPRIRKTTISSAKPAVQSDMEERSEALRCCFACCSYLFMVALL
jgi:hypothetical protein